MVGACPGHGMTTVEPNPEMKENSSSRKGTIHCPAVAKKYNRQAVEKYTVVWNEIAGLRGNGSIFC